MPVTFWMVLTGTPRGVGVVIDAGGGIAAAPEFRDGLRSLPNAKEIGCEHADIVQRRLDGGCPRKRRNADAGSEIVTNARLLKHAASMAELEMRNWVKPS